MIKHFVLILTIGLLSSSAAGQTIYSCGPRPKNVPTAVESKLEVDAKAKANLFLKWIGTAELDSNVDRQKKELYAAHKDYDKFMTDSYFQWVACQIIINSKEISDDAKVSKWRDVYESIYPQLKVNRSTPSAVAQGSETTFISPEVRAEQTEGHGGGNVEKVVCFQPDDNYRFDPATAVIETIQDSQNNDIPPQNVSQLVNSPGANSTPPNKSRICVQAVARPNRDTHATIIVRLKVKQQRIASMN